MKSLRSSLFVLLLVGGTLAATVSPGPAVAQDPAATAQQWQASYDAEARGDLRGALEALEAVGQESRDGYLFHLRRGWLRYSLGAYEDAAVSYKAAVQADGKATEARLGLMLPLMGLRRWADAAGVAEEVLAIDAENYTARSRLAWCRYNQGRYADAEAAYRKVLAGYPSDVEMRTGLGWSLHLQGKSKDAIAEFDQVLAVAPQYTTAIQGKAAAKK